MKANSPTLPPIPVRTGPARASQRSGPVPAWGLKLGGLLTTLAVFLGSFGYANANLYVTKTVYAVVFAVVVGVSGWLYPCVPRQMTVVSSLTIGKAG